MFKTGIQEKHNEVNPRFPRWEEATGLSWAALQKTSSWTVLPPGTVPVSCCRPAHSYKHLELWAVAPPPPGKQACKFHS